MLLLIAHRDEETRALLSSMLVSAGFMIETAETALQAITKAILVVPDVVLLDHGLDARAVIRRLNANLQTNGIPIAALSVRRAALKQVLREGFSGAISSPFDSAELLATIRQVRKAKSRRPFGTVPRPLTLVRRLPCTTQRRALAVRVR